MKTEASNNDESGVDDIKAHLNNWARQANILRYIHGFLTSSATVSSFLVAAKITDEHSPIKPYVSWISFIAAVSIGLLSAFDLGSKANRFRRAWRLLNTELMRYKKGKVDVDKLIDTYFEAEQMIGDVKEQPE